jgi:hypothetical protein
VGFDLRFSVPDKVEIFLSSTSSSFLFDLITLLEDTMSAPSTDTIRANWRCFAACGIIVLSPFQYGLDFGLIGGLQAMPGFLKVSLH